MKKFLLRNSRSQSGSMLITAAVAAAILAILIGSILSYISNEYAFNLRSHAWTQALHLAESGIEVGFAEYNNYYLPNSNAFASARGWQGILNYYWMPHPISLTNSVGQIVGTYQTTVYGFNSTAPYLVAVSSVNVTPRGPQVQRKIVCYLKLNAQFPAGMVAKGGIDMKGQNVTTDSYDSTDLTKSTNGQYDATKKQGNGDIATTDAITNSNISAGNANIYGTVSTGNSGTVTLGANGVIDPQFISPAATTVAQAAANGWERNDFAVDIPDVNVPSGATTWTSLGSLGNQTVNSGNYRATDITLQGNNNLVINGNVNLYITGSGGISMKGNGVITINAGGSLTVYSYGNMSIAGNGIVNSALSDMKCQLYGLPTCTSVSIDGNGNWDGVVYAPEADFSLKGGGSNGDMQGGIVAKSITMTGQVTFHYDEALRKSGPNATYNINSWQSQRLNATTGLWVNDN